MLWRQQAPPGSATAVLVRMIDHNLLPHTDAGAQATQHDARMRRTQQAQHIGML
ncbi:uncharacterized protein SEPMUDRAFT_149112 [Sphaerulina musiva SO2202]|uniref:Uncharacterized protein n=1 Tax=Sphaerulina musiva (strain SO2202) TaxID=692275 RepID=M3D3G5_SPHMS|nr:uncharacterized protein SEPMUDRAFT_149112 [Sphaerulina musiva SO2202]EMF12429.1 hypothetical protein SEPMUDRAFT_149112 [Sphaerulina musiva SO2202]